MLEKQFEELYLTFRANYYHRTLEKASAGGISATESYCVEIIHLMGRPSVSRFARYLGISVPNANYKINNLVEKGYVVRLPSPRDQREQLLQVTDKFLDFYGLNSEDNVRLMQRIRERFTPAEVDGLEATITRILALMAEDAGTGRGAPAPERNGE